jgi:hypothetical protein
MLLAAFSVAFAAALVLGAFDRKDEEAEPAPVAAPAEGPIRPRAEPRGGETDRPAEQPSAQLPEEAADEGEGPSGPPPETDPERAAADAFRAFVRALARRDADAVCAAFAPGALRGVDFPDPRGSCPESVAASLGFRDRRGLPVWDTSRLGGPISARVDGDEARVVATVITRYADNREPSIEDDVAYLELRGDRWLLRQPSATFYRAIGVAEVPPSVLQAPE